MATYQADVITTSAPAKHGLETVTAVGKITVGTALVAADIVQFVKIPAGAVVTEVKASCSGSLGSTLTAEFGDGDDTDRYIASVGECNLWQTRAIRLQNQLEPIHRKVDSWHHNVDLNPCCIAAARSARSNEPHRIGSQRQVGKHR